jgi:hypothetical protein
MAPRRQGSNGEGDVTVPLWHHARELCTGVCRSILEVRSRLEILFEMRVAIQGSPQVTWNILLDVAALSNCLAMPLSARLILAPRKVDGERVHFDDPNLTDSDVMSLGGSHCRTSLRQPSQ